MNFKIIILLPILEIILLILFGNLLGFFPVLILIFISGFFGFYLLKINVDIDEIKEVSKRPENWIYKKIAGILLIIPGFATDIIGLILLFKSLRGLVWFHVPENLKEKYKDNNKEIIDIEYKDLDDK